MNLKKKNGQILVLVLLIVVVILAIGLSVASRNLTNLRTSTQAEQSQRAFTAAEGGVEDVLAKLNTVASVINSNAPAGSGGCTKVGADTANCTFPTNSDTTISGAVKVRAVQGYEKTIEPGEVAQINVGNYPAGGTFDIEWVKTGDPTSVTLMINFLCKNSPTSDVCYDLSQNKASNAYGQYRLALTTPGATFSGTQTGVPNCDPNTGQFSCVLHVTLPAGRPQNVAIIRIKPFWNRTTVKITPTGGSQALFPVQTYEITSTATTETGVSRKVEVRRDALPQLPAIFDYVLFSEKDIVK